MADANSIRIAGRSSNGTPLYECICPDCGTVRLQDKRKLGKPCHPCAMKRRATHGMSNHWLYNVWARAKARCTCPGASNFQHYGGRGIRMCDAWLADSATFLAWALENGAKRGLELDRIDPNGNYCPENCRFISHKDNSRNRTNARCDVDMARRIKAALSEGKSVRAISKEMGIHYMIVWHISKGNTWKEV